MPRKSENRTKYILLGLLMDGPKSGYDMKKVIAMSTANFWKEGNGQIYPTLSLLEKSGSITKDHIPQSGKPDKNPYTITDKGRKEFLAWMEKPCQPQKTRSEIALRLFFGRYLSPKNHAKNLRDIIAAQEAILAHYSGLEQMLKGWIAQGSTDARFGLMVLKLGIHQAQSAIAGCEEILNDIEEFEHVHASDSVKKEENR